MSLAIVVIFMATAPADVPPATEKVRCVREQVTGSLVSTRKVCHTDSEWRRIRNDAQNEARRITQPGKLNNLNN